MNDGAAAFEWSDDVIPKRPWKKPTFTVEPRPTGYDIPDEPEPNGYDADPDMGEEPPPHPGDKQKQKAAGDTWGEPVDFFADDTMGAPKLEQEHVPEALWPFVTDTATRMGVDPTCVALSSLVACASVISDEWFLQPKRNDYTWTENARLWGAIVGDPSILKTPVIYACTKPIDKLEMEARKQHADAMRKWRKEADARKNKTDIPPQPICDRYMVEGTTVEALSEVLRDDEDAKMRAPQGKVLSRHDEMSEFFSGLDRYQRNGKGGSERGAYLRLYNGGRYTVDRIGRGSFAIPSWSACFLGGVQPGPIQRMYRAGNRRRRPATAVCLLRARQAISGARPQAGPARHRAIRSPLPHPGRAASAKDDRQ